MDQYGTNDAIIFSRGGRGGGGGWGGGEREPRSRWSYCKSSRFMENHPYDICSHLSEKESQKAEAKA